MGKSTYRKQPKCSVNSALSTCPKTVCVLRTANIQVLEDIYLKHYRLYRRLIQTLIFGHTASVGSRSGLCSCEVIYLRLFLNLLGRLNLFTCVACSQQHLLEVIQTRGQVYPEASGASKTNLVTNIYPGGINDNYIKYNE